MVLGPVIDTFNRGEDNCDMHHWRIGRVVLHAVDQIVTVVQRLGLGRHDIHVPTIRLAANSRDQNRILHLRLDIAFVLVRGTKDVERPVVVVVDLETVCGRPTAACRDANCLKIARGIIGIEV